MSTMTWNPQSHSDYDLLKGYDVYTSDDEKVGTFKAVLHPQTEMPTARGRHYFKVEPGILKQLFSDQAEFYPPERLIQTVQPQEDKVILEMPKSRLKNEDWMQPRVRSRHGLWPRLAAGAARRTPVAQFCLP